MFKREALCNVNIHVIRSTHFISTLLYFVLTFLDVIIKAEFDLLSNVSASAVVTAGSELLSNVSASVVTEPYDRTHKTTVTEVPHIGRFDIRVGKIVHIEIHPGADSLYLEKVDVGEEQPRTVISALVAHVPIEQMQNRTALFLVNLKPLRMRGIFSEGMIMCAHDEDGNVDILVPPSSAEPGEFVQVEGYERKPDARIDARKKMFEAVQIDLKTNEKGEATYKGNTWNVADKGPVKSLKLINATIS